MLFVAILAYNSLAGYGGGSDDEFSYPIRTRRAIL